MANYNRRSGRKTKEKFRRSWERLQNGLSRRIIVYQPGTRNECPNCYYDKKSGKSSGIPKVSEGNPNYFTVGRCPVCLGDGVLTTTRRKYIDGIVIWNPVGEGMDSMTFTEAGYESAINVQIKTDPQYLSTLKSCEYIVVDGIKCTLSTPPIMRGIGEKAILVAEFFSTEKMDPDSGEYV